DATLKLSIANVIPGKLLINPSEKVAAACPDQLDLELNIATSLMSLLGKPPPPPNSPLAAVNLRNFRISAPDPAQPGKSLDLVACRKLDVDLTQPIVTGKP